MASNPYVNKVQKADGTTIIDISDSTATQADVASGKYIYLATGQKVQGSIADGNNLEYGLTDGTQPIAGVARANSAVLGE